jgi:hypothetical protein
MLLWRLIGNKQINSSIKGIQINTKNTKDILFVPKLRVDEYRSYNGETEGSIRIVDAVSLKLVKVLKLNSKSNSMFR